MPERFAIPAPALPPGPAPVCRVGCGACCTAPSISSPIPGMPLGKPAGMPCVQLDAAGRCRLFGHPCRPAVCSNLQPSTEMCGSSQAQALQWLARLEADTAPSAMADGKAPPAGGASGGGAAYQPLRGADTG